VWRISWLVFASQMTFLHVLFFYYVSSVSYLSNIYGCQKVKNYKSILIAGAIAVGLYFFLHAKKILPMTPQQKAARRDKITHMMAHLTQAEIDNAYRKARKEKASAEGTPEEKTRPTPMEWMLAIRAAAEEKEKRAEEEQGTGFDYIRERAPYNKAVPVEKRKYASILKSAERIREEKRRREEQIAAELEEETIKQKETQEAYKNELLKNVKPKDLGYSKKKTTEDVLKDLELWALPRSDVEHVQESEEEPEEEEKTSKKKTTEHIVKDYVEQQKKQKLKDQGYSKKKTTEDVLKDFGLWALP